jgi:hypothetical protein
VPPIARRIESEKAGRIATHSATDFASKILEIAEPSAYADFRKHALALGKEYEWDVIFRAAFTEL